MNCLSVGTSLLAIRFAKARGKARSAGETRETVVFFPEKSPFFTERAEVLAAFTNSVALLLVSAFLVFEALHSLTGDVRHADHDDHVALVGFASVLINAWGLKILAPLTGGWRKMWDRAVMNGLEDGDQARMLNVEAVALHTGYDVVSSLGVIFASAMQKHGVVAADAMVTVLIAALTVRGVGPMFMLTSRILAQASGFHADRYFRELQAAEEGILEFSRVHFWSLAPSKVVGSFAIRARHDADEDRILKAAHTVFGSAIWELTVQIEKERPVSLAGIDLHHHGAPMSANSNKLDRPLGLKEAARIL